MGKEEVGKREVEREREREMGSNERFSPEVTFCKLACGVAVHIMG